MENKRTTSQIDRDKIIKGTELILQGLQENLNREGLKETPLRVGKAFEELFQGYNADFTFLNKTFEAKSNDVVEMENIRFYSMCEHHILPFFGVCTVKYKPKNRVIGLSKIPRLVDLKSRKLQLQEQLTFEIADELKKALDCEWVEVEIEARHMCVEMRGIKQTNSLTKTRIKL